MNMEYAKLINETTFDVVETTDENRILELLEMGYLPTLELNSLPSADLYTYCFYTLELDKTNNVYNKTWHTNIGEVILNKINVLKKQLADTDYKVVKNMEYQMAMMSSVEPNTIILDLYDPKELHDERQALRDKINELEQLLKGE